jgi:hypothetical protein
LAGAIGETDGLLIDFEFLEGESHDVSAKKERRGESGK